MTVSSRGEGEISGIFRSYVWKLVKVFDESRAVNKYCDSQLTDLKSNIEMKSIKKADGLFIMQE